MKAKAIVGIALCTLSAYSENAARKTQDAQAKINVRDYMRFGLVAGTRALDYSTTREGVRLGDHEVVLPKSFASSDAHLLSYEGTLSAVQIAGDVWLIKKHHRKLAEALDWSSIGVGLLVDASNKRAIDTMLSRRSKLTRE